MADQKIKNCYYESENVYIGTLQLVFKKKKDFLSKISYLIYADVS